MRTNKYDLRGFQLINNLDESGYVYLDQAAVSIESGDCIFDNGSGYATNVGTQFAATFRGIAGVASDNSAGSNGDVKIPVILPLFHNKFIVKDTGQLLDQDAVGSIVDLKANDAIDSSDVTLAEWGFVIDEIDVSTAAKTANAFGFAQGRFQKVPQ